jgi:hypothetical protein
MRVLPVPPLEQLRIVVIVAGVVDRATKDVENTPVDVCTSTRAELLVQILGIGIPQVFHAANTKVMEIDRDTLTHARNAP